MFINRIAVLTVILAVSSFALASPYATEVVSYTAGSNSSSSYRDASVALGSPRRTMPGGWGGDLTPFNAEWYADQIVAIGSGTTNGSLVVKFDHQVQDNSSGVQYGVDFIVFGNAFYSNSGGTAGGCFSEPVNIAVSQDGSTWYDISGVYADTEFPTMAYTNTSSAYAADGTIETDYTTVVDPGFSASGKTLAQLQAGYAGSGGGTGVDISGTGLSWIQYVKVYQTSGAAGEIDGFADVVPEPVTLSLLCVGGLTLMLRRRRVG